METNRKRNFAYPKIDIRQKTTRLFESFLRHIIDELDSGYLFKLFAQMSRINSGRAGNLAQRERFVGVLFDKFPGAPNVSGFGPVTIRREDSESSESRFGCVFQYHIVIKSNSLNHTLQQLLFPDRILR